VIRLRDVALEIAERPLLAGVTFDAAPGEIIVVIGPNGVGKTTLLRAVAGQHPVRAGAILVDGTVVSSLTARERARRIAFLAAEEPPIESLVVREVVATGRYPYHQWWEWREDARDIAAVAKALTEVRMDAMRERLFSTLSSGERRNAWIALALAQETSVLILDEPTTHLDVHVAQRILALLRRLANAGKTVLCALHDLNEAAAYADRIVLLAEGRMRATGQPDEVLASPVLDEAYATAMERLHLSDGTLRVFARPYPSGEGAP
jgi:ABC-type cobalamin/Fe3+-siderophores transport system ATPase subunit